MVNGFEYFLDNLLKENKLGNPILNFKYNKAGKPVAISNSYIINNKKVIKDVNDIQHNIDLYREIMEAIKQSEFNFKIIPLRGGEQHLNVYSPLPKNISNFANNLTKDRYSVGLTLILNEVSLNVSFALHNDHAKLVIQGCSWQEIGKANKIATFETDLKNYLYDNFEIEYENTSGEKANTYEPYGVPYEYHFIINYA